jgi:small-conductance mechanosensitive channel
MSPWQGIVAEATDDYSFVLAVAFGISAVVARIVGLERRRMLGIAAMCALHTLLLPIVGVLRARGSSLYQDVRLPCLIFAGMAAVSMAGIMVFYVALPRLHLRVPKIVQDVVTGLVALVVLLGIAARAGYNITGLVATSAVLTAVIGLALQDTLGNIVSGLALQTEDSINVGDWIRVGDREGRVSEVRWRYTAIETRDWDTIFIPNSQLVKERVTVLGEGTRDGARTAQQPPDQGAPQRGVPRGLPLSRQRGDRRGGSRVARLSNAERGQLAGAGLRAAQDRRQLRRVSGALLHR